MHFIEDNILFDCRSKDNDDLRLFSYSCSSGVGRLEMYYRNKWTPFCITDFDMHDADLACKKLGYIYANRYATVERLG